MKFTREDFIEMIVAHKNYIKYLEMEKNKASERSKRYILLKISLEEAWEHLLCLQRKYNKIKA